MEIFGQTFSIFELVGISLGTIILFIFIFDVFIQKKYAILHNFPVLRHMRHLLTMIARNEAILGC